MVIIDTVAGMKEYVAAIKARKETIGFVPTMGYLHEGHLDLMRLAKKLADHTITSIFVNPTQFGVNEDLDKYPRDMEGDKKRSESVGVECIFAPTAKEMYPRGYATYINLEGITNTLCGISRPTHFRGVATVVVKLFNIVEPDFAIFGEKDFQQLLVIKRMVKDLNMKVQVVGHPIVRESDGLAMSSRNKYLSPEERKKALILNKSLKHARELFKDGLKDTLKLKDVISQMIASVQGCVIDYVEVIDAEDLSPIKTIKDKALIALAVKVGTTRLIDNTVLGEQLRL
jgi:pantoate--beta-alanine ligase